MNRRWGIAEREKLKLRLKFYLRKWIDGGAKYGEEEVWQKSRLVKKIKSSVLDLGLEI